ncbi:5-formyltetrahydrofolate cyclo-ligase [Aquitalea denitrificans]|uniref:5-formyltetrahydrofolate cyclo-ligase n=1 Tax=Aquitalea denitrificans TaxID=519081 RepID=UPI00135B599C|nr:5-formyltetrahydrofolate cyclo-ligase [Aquitalea denitrificans]
MPTPDTAFTDKIALRKAIRRQRMALTPTYRAQAMRAVARHASRLLQRGRRIGGYLAAGSELDVEILLSTALLRGASVWLPQIPARGRRMWFSRLSGSGCWYRHARYGIVEFDGPCLRAEKLDVLLVPLLAVDEQGYRMGQGGGFYDSSLGFRQRPRRYGKPLLVGVAYDCQRVATVPREAWDVQLDYLLTESGLHRFTRSPGDKAS